MAKPMIRLIYSPPEIIQAVVTKCRFVFTTGKVSVGWDSGRKIFPRGETRQT